MAAGDKSIRTTRDATEFFPFVRYKEPRDWNGIGDWLKNLTESA